ncbi:uncharacterized protein LOC116541952 [Sapajus apella]|uniref:Uncharacterized protein LOC116541952 n=1 Tax=Sapajus apella TaxID=9515 RepID=A0A6J3GWV7_SAPAP|nr:uncharacterized protein LOC116541952 [Sapajus apella]
MTETSPLGALRHYKPGSSCFRLSCGQSRAWYAPELSEWTNKLSLKTQRSLDPGDGDRAQHPARAQAFPRAAGGPGGGCLQDNGFCPELAPPPLCFLEGDLGRAAESFIPLGQRGCPVATAHRILSSHSPTLGCPVFQGGEGTGAMSTPLALLLDPKVRLDPFILWGAPALAIGMSFLKSLDKRVRDSLDVPQGRGHTHPPADRCPESSRGMIPIPIPIPISGEARTAIVPSGKTQLELKGPCPCCNCAENVSQMTQIGSYFFLWPLQSIHEMMLCHKAKIKDFMAMASSSAQGAACFNQFIDKNSMVLTLQGKCLLSKASEDLMLGR